MTISMTNIATKIMAFMYVRVSTPNQEVDEQVKMIRQYADEHGIEIIGQYSDSEAAQVRPTTFISSDVERH